MGMNQATNGALKSMRGLNCFYFGYKEKETEIEIPPKTAKKHKGHLTDFITIPVSAEQIKDVQDDQARRVKKPYVKHTQVEQLKQQSEPEK